MTGTSYIKRENFPIHMQKCALPVMETPPIS